MKKALTLMGALAVSFSLFASMGGIWRTKETPPEDLRDRTWRAKAENVSFTAHDAFENHAPVYEVRYAGAGATGEGRLDLAVFPYLWMLDSWIPPYVATRVRMLAYSGYPLASSGGSRRPTGASRRGRTTGLRGTDPNGGGASRGLRGTDPNGGVRVVGLCEIMVSCTP